MHQNSAMSIPLAFRRCASLYAPPLRRSVARNVNFAFFWLIGLCTGLLAAPVNHDRVMAGFLVGLVILWALRLWATPHADRHGETRSAVTPHTSAATRPSGG